MTIQPTAPRPTASTPPPDNPVEAARQFESVLVRQFVEVMTKDLFKATEEGMMTGQADLQRDTLTDTLTEHLVDAGTFGIADLLTAQWDRQGRTDSALEDAVPSGAPSRSLGSEEAPSRPAPIRADGVPRRALSMDDALRLYPPAKDGDESLDLIPGSSP